MSSYSKLKTLLLNFIPYFCYSVIFVLAGASILSVVDTKLFLISASILFIVVGTDLKKNGRFPVFLSFIYFAFSIIISISLPLAYVLEDSILQVLLMISFFIVFLRVYNDKNIESKLTIFILIVTIIFSLLYLVSLFKVEWFAFQKSVGEQFITVAFGHNNLGHLASLTGIICLYFYLATKKRIYLLLIIFFSSILLISFSRAAYLSFIVVAFLLIVMKYKDVLKRKKGIFFILVICSVTVFSILFIGLSLESRHIPAIKSLYGGIIDSFELSHKDLFARRPEYWINAVKAIFDHPLGVGHGGYTWMNLKYTQFPYSFSTSAHNIILDTYVSYGVIGGSFFVYFLLLLILSAVKKIIYPSTNLYSNALAYGLLSMFVGMQFDFVHNIPIYLFLFITIGGILYEDVGNIELKKVYEIVLAISIILIFFVFQYYFSDALFKQGQYKMSVYTFPFRSYLYRPAIQNELSNKNVEKARDLIKWYEFIHGKNPDVILDLGNIYQQMGFYDAANHKYSKYISLVTYPYLPHIEMIYQFKGKYMSQKEALAMKKNYCQRFAIKLRSKASYICEFNKN